MRILGIASMFHDASTCIIEDGEILFAGHANAKTTEDGTAWAAHVLPVTLGRRLMVHHLRVLAMHLPRICHAFAMQISALQRSMPGAMAICRRACRAERTPGRRTCRPECCSAEEHHRRHVALQKSMPGSMLLFKRATLENLVVPLFLFLKLMMANMVCEQK